MGTGASGCRARVRWAVSLGRGTRKVVRLAGEGRGASMDRLMAIGLFDMVALDVSILSRSAPYPVDVSSGWVPLSFRGTRQRNNGPGGPRGGLRPSESHIWVGLTN